MSKRRNRRTQPNLPEETLARARREAGLEEAPEEETSAPEPEEQPVAVAAPEERPSARRNRDDLPPAQRRSRRRSAEPKEMTHAEVAELLANPTRQVSTDELRQQYSYVVADLRSMGLLAALLFIVMIVAAQIL